MTDKMSKGMSEAGRESKSADWGAEEEYWRANYGTRPYVTADRGYDYYEPGYRYGTESASAYRGRSWDEVEPDLRKGWEGGRHAARSTWEDIKSSVRDAWDRITGQSSNASPRDPMKRMNE